MKIKGTKRTIDHIDVEVAPFDALKAIEHVLKEKYRVGQDWYINRNGQWEEWTDTGHGSGLTDIHRYATDEELEVAKALSTLKDAMRGIN